MQEDAEMREKCPKCGNLIKIGDGSKWTRKRTYVQILRAVCCMGVRLLFDDWAGSHNGTGPDHFLRTMGGRRIRIPRNATWLLQAADHHTVRFSEECR